MKRTILLITACCSFLVTSFGSLPATQRPLATGAGTELHLAAVPLPLDKPDSHRLIAVGSPNIETDVTFEPTDATVVQTFESPILATATVPADKHRSYLYVTGNVEYAWTQIVSTAPYRLTGSYSYVLTSSVLPSPGQMRIRVTLDSQTDAHASNVEIARQRDPALAFMLEENALAPIVKGTFPTLTDEQALGVAHALLQSQISIEMKVEIKVRSVQDFFLGRPSLQVWGD